MKIDSEQMTLIEGIKAPTGMLKEVDEWACEGEDGPRILIYNKDVRVEINFSRGANAYFRGTGHTSFFTGQDWLTFDREGIEDSFYVDVDETVMSLQEKVEDQILLAWEVIELEVKKGIK